MECPIGLGKVYCQDCCFWRHDKCDYDKIMKEMKHCETMERISEQGKELNERVMYKGQPAGMAPGLQAHPVIHSPPRTYDMLLTYGIATSSAWHPRQIFIKIIWSNLKPLSNHGNPDWEWIRERIDDR